MQLINILVLTPLRVPRRRHSVYGGVNYPQQTYDIIYVPWIACIAAGYMYTTDKKPTHLLHFPDKDSTTKFCGTTSSLRKRLSWISRSGSRRCSQLGLKSRTRLLMKRVSLITTTLIGWSNQMTKLGYVQSTSCTMLCLLDPSGFCRNPSRWPIRSP